jgi:hypothetical protein
MERGFKKILAREFPDLGKVDVNALSYAGGQAGAKDISLLLHKGELEPAQLVALDGMLEGMIQLMQGKSTKAGDPYSRAANLWSLKRSNLRSIRREKDLLMPESETETVGAAVGRELDLLTAETELERSVREQEVRRRKEDGVPALLESLAMGSAPGEFVDEDIPQMYRTGLGREAFDNYSNGIKGRSGGGAQKMYPTRGLQDPNTYRGTVTVHD